MRSLSLHVPIYPAWVSASYSFDFFDSPDIWSLVPSHSECPLFALYCSPFRVHGHSFAPYCLCSPDGEYSLLLTFPAVLISPSLYALYAVAVPASLRFFPYLHLSLPCACSLIRSPVRLLARPPARPPSDTWVTCVDHQL
jgi:hypothetical protein